MKNNHRQSLGKWGEKTAAAYLQTQGFRIVGYNYRTPYGELDIIAQEEEYLVFVEVKTRSNDRFGSPLEAVTFIKQQHLRCAAELYLQANPTNAALRFDVVSIMKKSGEKPQIEHIRGAF